MGREIRRVPADWEHPRTNHPVRGWEFHPCFDEAYEDALARWQEERRQWDADEPMEYSGRRTEVLAEHPDTTFEEWVGEPPDPAYYRSRKWTAAEATAYQFYETVTEGSPLSPVCPTREAMVKWLTTAHVDLQGYGRTPMSQVGAEAFVDDGWAPSMIASPEHGVEMGMEFVDREAQEKAES